MTDAKHTPGPWVITKTLFCGPLWVEDDANPCRRRIAIIDNGAGIDSPEANARLVAAAPELLSSGADILPTFETLCKAQDIDMDEDNVFAAVYRNLLSAIEKATGKEQ